MGFALFYTLKRTIGLRASTKDETLGLDITEHGETAYN
jgi:ammonia channel protein AmtB